MADKPRHRGARSALLVGLLAGLTVAAGACSSGTSPLASSAPPISPAPKQPITEPTEPPAPTTTTTVPAPATTPPTTTPQKGSATSLAQRSAVVRKALEDGVKKQWVEVTGAYENKDAATKVTTLSGPTGGYQSVVEGKASCRLIVLRRSLYVSCNPLGGVFLAGWAAAGAKEVGTRWVAYTAGDPEYEQLSTAITTSSDLSALVQNGSVGSSGTEVGPPTTRRSGSTTTVTAPLVVSLQGATVRGSETITITGSSDPLLSSVRVKVGGTSGEATLSGWGADATWKKDVRAPAGAVPYRRFARVLAPSATT